MKIFTGLKRTDRGPTTYSMIVIKWHIATVKIMHNNIDPLLNIWSCPENYVGIKCYCIKHENSSLHIGWDMVQQFILSYFLIRWTSLIVMREFEGSGSTCDNIIMSFYFKAGTLIYPSCIGQNVFIILHCKQSVLYSNGLFFFFKLLLLKVNTLNSWSCACVCLQMFICVWQSEGPIFSFPPTPKPL